MISALRSSGYGEIRECLKPEFAGPQSRLASFSTTTSTNSFRGANSPASPSHLDFHAFAVPASASWNSTSTTKSRRNTHSKKSKTQKTGTLRVDRMKLSKDKTELRYNDFLTLRGIPAAAFDYRLGNRSALEWVIDQYRVSTDTRSGIVNDPNREDDPQYILRLIGQVITVSLETQQIIAALPSLKLAT